MNQTTPLPEPPVGPAQVPPPPETARSPETRQRSRPGSKLRIVGAVVMLLGAAGVGVWGGWQLRDRQESQPEPVTVEVSIDRPVVVLDEQSRAPGAMPSVVGLTIEQGRQALADAGVDLAAVSEQPAPYSGPGGQIIAQDPPGGATAPSAVALTYSQATAVPTMVGANVNDVREVLTDLGVRVDVITTYVPGQAEGTVLSSTPVAGEPLPTELSLEVAEAASSVFLADLRANTSDCGIDDSTVNAVEHVGSIVCVPRYDDVEAVEYVLNREVDQFAATIGLDDRSEVGAPTWFRVFVDGTLAFEVVMSYGSSQDINVPVAGALRLRLETSRSDTPDTCCDTDAVWGSARLLGGLDAVTRIFEESNS